MAVPALTRAVSSGRAWLCFSRGATCQLQALLGRTQGSRSSSGAEAAAGTLLTAVAVASFAGGALSRSLQSASCEEALSGEEERREVRLSIISGNWPQVEAWVHREGLDAPLTGSGQSALCFAAEHGAVFIARKLLEANADVQSCDRQGLSVLLHASRKGHAPVVEALLQARAQPDSPSDIFGNAPIHGACGFGHVNVVRLLLEAGCDPNLRTGDVRAPPEYGAHTLHEAPLHLACRIKPPHLEMQSWPLIVLLLRYGANPCLQDDRGDTPVHFLARKGDASTLWMLLSRLPPHQAETAAWDCRNEFGATAQEEAEVNGSSLGVRLALRFAPHAARLRHQLGIRADLREQMEADTASEEKTWQTYRERLDSASSLLSFEEGGDGARKRRQPE